MARPVQELEYVFDVEFIEISEDVDPDRRAGIFLLLQWIKEARNSVEPTGSQAQDHTVADELVSSPVPLAAGSSME